MNLIGYELYFVRISIDAERDRDNQERYIEQFWANCDRVVVTDHHDQITGSEVPHQSLNQNDNNNFTLNVSILIMRGEEYKAIKSVSIHNVLGQLMLNERGI